MSSTVKKPMLVALGVAALLLFVMSLTRGHQDANAGDTSNGVYYTGPMQAKNGSGKWVDYQGHIVAAPPGAKTVAPPVKSGGHGDE